MTKLSFEPVDFIQAATGENHFYRAFQVEDESWIVYVHEFDGPAQEFRGEPLSYVTSTFERAQVFAQAFEDSAAEKNTSKRVALATRITCGIPQEG